jgi:hypothetical protein
VAAADFRTECAARCEDGAAASLVGLASLPCDTAAPGALDRLGFAEVCAECNGLATDYSPGGDDSWAACISDDGAYHPFADSISSAGRVGGFEQIAELLWRPAAAPTAEAFLAAREVFAADEGLDSRIQRREDAHYPPVTDASGTTLLCRDEGVPALDPDRCVGPAQMVPILNEAFSAGIGGQTPRVNAARIEATLLWFLYVSVFKEATTCATNSADCDSSYAYYTGDRPRDAGIGIAGKLRTTSPAAHDAVWDGILAYRCWRDLDPAQEATDLASRDRALDQLDRALLYGVARLVEDRLVVSLSHQDDALDADRAFVQILGPVLLRAARQLDANEAANLEANLDGIGTGEIDVSETVQILGSLFPCPR